MTFTSVSYASDEVVLEYNGKNNSFKYINTENTDLFKNFKDLMPGDTKEQVITISTKNIKQETKMYLKISNEGMDELSKNGISLKVFNEADCIYDNSKDGNSEQVVYLHTFSNDTEFKIRVVVDVPEDISNEIEELKLNIKWKFMVEEAGKSVEVDLPKTSDDVGIYVFLALVSLIVVIIAMITLRETNSFHKNFKIF